MARKGFKPDPQPLTLGQSLASHLRLIAWCKAWREPDVAEQIAQHGGTMTVIDWAARLVCSRCGKRSADFVVSGARR